jgi:hypothetical protein
VSGAWLSDEAIEEAARVREENDALRAKLTDRERRIRLARRSIGREPFVTVDDRDAVLAALDLRRPLKGRKR